MSVHENINTISEVWLQVTTATFVGIWEKNNKLDHNIYYT